MRGAAWEDIPELSQCEKEAQVEFLRRKSDAAGEAADALDHVIAMLRDRGVHPTVSLIRAKHELEQQRDDNDREADQVAKAWGINEHD